MQASTVLAVVATLAALPAQPQFDELSRRYLPPGSANAIAVGDVDVDGDVDVVCANGERQDTLLLGDGTGRFVDATAARMPRDPATTLDLALGDVDGDGDLDLVLATGSWPGGQNRLYLNDGTGLFTDVTAARMPVDADVTYSVALGDVDGDGDLDVVFGNAPQPDRLYLNDGAGRFRDATSGRLPVGGTTPVLLADVDGDGDLDLATGALWPEPTKLYLNHGNGTFAEAGASRLPPGRSSPLLFADVDGDRDLDLVVWVVLQEQYCVGLYLNDGSGHFADVTVARMPCSNAGSVVALDVDGDGDLDLLLGAGGGGAGRQQNRLYRNDGQGTFTDVTSMQLPQIHDVTSDVAFADVDGDGDLDVLLANYPDNDLWLNDGSGAFWSTTARRVPDGVSHSVLLADFDGDGAPELVGGLALKLFHNDGNGRFTDESAARLPVSPSYRTYSMAAADMDGDGDLDLLCGNSYLSMFSGQPNALYLNDGRGRFNWAGAHWQTSDDTLALAVGDLDGDGDVDVVCGNAGLRRRQNGLFLNDGTGRLADVTAARLPVDDDYTVAAALGDVDGDGDLDLAFGSLVYLGPGCTKLHLNDGHGTFVPAPAGRLPADVGTLALVFDDVDADGDLDLVLGKAGQNRLFLNDGRGRFADATAVRLPAVVDETVALAFGDADGDGDRDLFVANFGRPTEANRLYLNNGHGKFSPATATRFPAHADDTQALALGDVDGDGDLDVFFANGQYGPDRLYLNLQRQVAAPGFAILGRPYTLDVHAETGFASSTQKVVPLLSLVPAVPAIPIPPFGLLGLDPGSVIALPLVSVPAPRGRASVTLTMPGDPALQGLTLFVQALVQHRPEPSSWRLTNVHAEPLQR